MQVCLARLRFLLMLPLSTILFTSARYFKSIFRHYQLLYLHQHCHVPLTSLPCTISLTASAAVATTDKRPFHANASQKHLPARSPKPKKWRCWSSSDLVLNTILVTITRFKRIPQNHHLPQTNTHKREKIHKRNRVGFSYARLWLLSSRDESNTQELWYTKSSNSIKNKKHNNHHKAKIIN